MYIAVALYVVEAPEHNWAKVVLFFLLEIYLFCCNKTSLFNPWMDCQSSSIFDVEVLYFYCEVLRPEHFKIFDVYTIFMIAGFRFLYLAGY